MQKTDSQKKQARLLVLLLIAFAGLLGYSFGDRLNLPSASMVKQLRSQLASKKAELQKTSEEVVKYNGELEAARRRYELLKYNANLERDAQAKFDRILDDANVTKTKSSVVAVQNRNKASLQQVNINVEFEDITMRKLCDLFETFGMKALQGDAPLYWTKITITTRQMARRNAAVVRRGPGQQPQPQNGDMNRRQINVSATVSSYSLYSSASDLVFTEQKGLSSAVASEGRNAGKGGVKSSRGTTGRQASGGSRGARSGGVGASSAKGGRK